MKKFRDLNSASADTSQVPQGPECAGQEVTSNDEAGTETGRNRRRFADRIVRRCHRICVHRFAAQPDGHDQQSFRRGHRPGDPPRVFALTVEVFCLCHGTNLRGEPKAPVHPTPDLVIVAGYNPGAFAH